MKLALKVIYFADRQTRGSISPCNIAGFMSDVSEEAAIQTAEICRRRQPQCHLTPPPRGSPANIPINLIFPETRLIGLHFCQLPNHLLSLSFSFTSLPEFLIFNLAPCARLNCQFSASFQAHVKSSSSCRIVSYS